jgi:hypothetical protein
MTRKIFPYVTTGAAITGIWVAAHLGAAFSTPVASPPTPVMVQLTDYTVPPMHHDDHGDHADPVKKSPTGKSDPKNPATPPASNPTPQTCLASVDGAVVPLSCPDGPSNMTLNGRGEPHGLDAKVAPNTRAGCEALGPSYVWGGRECLMHGVNSGMMTNGN